MLLTKEGLRPHIFGLDLGQSQDYTALVLLERVGYTPAYYEMRHIVRYPLRTSYQTIADAVAKIVKMDVVQQQSVAPNVSRQRPVALVVDKTGVGAPVVDMLKRLELAPISVTITGGHEVTRVTGREYRVPKIHLVSAVQLLLNDQRMKIAPALPSARDLGDELRKFQLHKKGNTVQYEAPWREGEHDDLVLATALAAWYGETQVKTLDAKGKAKKLDWSNVAGSAQPTKVTTVRR